MVHNILVPLCPSESLTLVVAVDCLVASLALQKSQARPRRKACLVIANRAEPGLFNLKESMPWQNASSLPSNGYDWERS